MYQAYHYKYERKRKSPWKYVLLGIVFIGLVFLGYKYKNQIAIKFIGNAHQKFIKVENKTIEEFIAGNLKKETLLEFISTSSAFLQAEPLNPKASYGMAKGFFYNLYKTEMQFTLHEVYEYTLLETPLRNPSFYKLIEGMNRHALRARIFDEKFAETQGNLLLILLYETLSERVNPSFILKQFISIDYERLTPDLYRAYIWLGLINSINSGDLDELKIVLEKNKVLSKEFQIFLTERETKFLIGLTLFKANEFVRALENLREVRGGNDFLTIEATKLEAKIFYAQNLVEKAISILNDLDKQLSSKDESVKKLLAQFTKKKN